MSEPFEPTKRAVADHAGADIAMTSQVVRSLEARGLVTRERAKGEPAVLRALARGGLARPDRSGRVAEG